MTLKSAQHRRRGESVQAFAAEVHAQVDGQVELQKISLITRQWTCRQQTAAFCK